MNVNGQKNQNKLRDFSLTSYTMQRDFIKEILKLRLTVALKKIILSKE